LIILGPPLIQDGLFMRCTFLQIYTHWL